METIHEDTDVPIIEAANDAAAAVAALTDVAVSTKVDNSLPEPRWTSLDQSDILIPPAGPSPVDPISSAKKKIDLPTFSGDATDLLSAKNWLRKVSRICLTNGWGDFDALNLAIDGLRGPAWRWYESRANIYGLRTSFDVFRNALIRDFQQKASHKGVNHIIDMCEIHKNENVAALFDRINIAANDWLETITMPNRLPKSRSNPEAIRKLAGYASLSDEDAAKAYETGFTEGMQAVRNHLVIALYFRGLPKTISDKLLLLNLTNLEDIILKAQALETHLQSELAAINMVSKKRQATGPQNDAKKKMSCLYCKKKGHLQKECRKRIRENGKLVETPKRVNEVSDQKPDEQAESLNSLNF